MAVYPLRKDATERVPPFGIFGGPSSVVAVHPMPADATAARPSTYGETCARFARMFSFDLEGHALSWPCTHCVKTRPQRVPPFGIFGGPRSVVAVYPLRKDATERVPPFGIFGGPRSVVAVYLVLRHATAAGPSIWLRAQLASGSNGITELGN